MEIFISSAAVSKGRVRVGPGTLYSLLGKFEKEKMIRETEVQEEKRSYIITDKGKGVLQEEYNRLITMANDGLFYLKGEL